MTLLAVGVAGFLLWLATQVGMQTTGDFWASMGLVAAAGLVFALLPAMGSPVAGLRLRLSRARSCSGSCRRSSWSAGS